MNVTFHKYHGLGNDYLVIDPNKTDLEMTSEAVQLICHRNYGVGSDGILHGPFIQDGRMSLKIYNPDGSEAEKSGNGIRIFSRFLFDAGYVKATTFELDTLGGTVHVEYLDKQAKRIKVAMGTVTFQSDQIPVAGKSRNVIEEGLVVCGRELTVTCVSIGNPHCVVPLGEISKELACEYGPEIEHHAQFPNRINMQLLKVLNRNAIQIEIWERGAGYTLASGSSSCAAASVAYKLGLVDAQMTVHMPGGELAIEIQDDGQVHMIGEVTQVATGQLASDVLEQILNKHLPPAMVH